MYTKILRKLLTKVVYGMGHCVPESPAGGNGHCY